MADFTSNLQVKTSAVHHLVAKTVDTVINYSPMTMWLLSNQKQWKGSQIQMPIKYAANSNGTAFDALETFSTAKTDQFEKMVFNPVGREIPVVISGFELDVSRAGQVIDLLARQLESDAHDLADAVAGKFFTAQTGKEFLSLLDAAGDSTIAANYGGLSKTTYTGLAGNYTASIGSITLARLRTQINACTDGGDEPDLMVTTPAVFGYIEALMNATLQTTLLQQNLKGHDKFISTGAMMSAGASLKGQAGFNALNFAGSPIVADQKCNSGELYTLNKRTWAFHGLPSKVQGYTNLSFSSNNLDGVMTDAPKSLGFSFSGFKLPINQYGEVGHILLKGNLICSDPRKNGFLAGITG